ncbi:hypothetical protein [Herbaspirillum sp.]|uniref:hypothetical protein n=1 Tax=Herbaspirillum sp. TaxID=1890675 RepID=UPI001B0508FD|nr:hypothetical protein [Herbaspirillum sp.]MBO9537873.1 hypothetical protein [Herbaspirillum sp.]
MTFSIYALLGEGAPSITNESLASDLTYFFRNEEGFVLQFEQLPFAKIKTLALRWDAWLVRVSYEQGANVAQDSAEISKIVGDAGLCNIADIDKRIRVVFSDDDSQEHTNQIIYVMDFLREIPGVVIFDPQQQDLVT